MTHSLIELVEESKDNAPLLHNMSEEKRLPLVDYLRHGLGMTGEQIAGKLQISRSTVVRDLRALRKLRANLEIDYIPAKELAAEMTADAETCYAMALKNGDPVGAYAIKLKYAAEMRKCGLVQDADSDKIPVTLAGMRRKLTRKLKELAEKDTKALGPGGTNGAARTT